MKVLGVDSATDACSAAVWIDGRVAARRFAVMKRGHAEALMPMVVAVVGEAGIAFAEIDLVAATVGPGSFTGLRVGLAAARGLGLALGRPVIGITTLEAVAANVECDGRAALVALDDKRGGFYAQAFGPDGAPLGPPAAVDAAGLLGLAPSGPFVVAGDGAGGAHRILVAGDRDAAISKSPAAPDAAVVARLAARRRVEGAPLAPASPLYLRPPAVRLAPLVRIEASAEAGLLADLHRRCIGDAWDEAAIARLLGEGAGFALLARGENTAVGYVFGRVAADEGEILGLGVAPEARRRGAGRRLVEAALACARARGARRMFLEVAATSAQARRLYAASGFAEVAVRPKYYEPGKQPIDAVVLARDVGSTGG